MLDLILNLERRVWQAVIDKEGDALSELFAADYIEVTVDGRRVLKDDIVAYSPVCDEIESYRIGAAEMISLGKGSALLSYHLTLVGKLRGEPIDPRDRWTTSIWRETNGVWQCVFFQQSHYRDRSEDLNEPR